MYKLLQYYVHKDNIQYHLVSFSESEEEIIDSKNQLIEFCKNVDITILEIIATKNIDTLKEAMKNKDILIFQVLKD